MELRCGSPSAYHLFGNPGSIKEMDHADTELETCFKSLYDHVRGKTIGLRLTTGTYTEIFTPS
jgi:hypothetical protein